MQGVQPLLRRYCTWRAISWSERGGRKEKVSKNLEEEAKGRAEVSGCFPERNARGKKNGVSRP
jgi:hypothetical protein